MFLKLQIKFWKKRLLVADRKWHNAVEDWKACRVEYAAISHASGVYSSIRDRIERLERRRGKAS